VRPIDIDVFPERGTRATRNGAHVIVDRELDVLTRRQQHASVRLHELDIPAGLAELGPHCKERTPTRRVEHAERLSRDLGGSLLEGVIDRRANLLACNEVDED
jgi:hypothetical protein